MSRGNPNTSDKDLNVTTFTSEMHKMQFDTLVELIGKRNESVGKINAAQNDRDAVFESVAESNDDERVVDLRVKIAELQEQFDAIVNEKVDKVLAEATDESAIESLVAAVKEEDQTIRAGLSFYKKLYGDDAAKELPKVVRIKGKSGGGTGGKRIRGFNVIVSVDGGEGTEFENAAGAAKHLGLDTATLQEQFFAKAGVEKIKDAPDEVKFGLSWDEEPEEEGGESTSHSAEVTFYRTGESGVASSSDADDEDEDEPTDEDLADVDEDDLSNL